MRYRENGEAIDFFRAITAIHHIASDWTEEK